MGQTQVTKEAVWLKLLLQELNTSSPIKDIGKSSIYHAIYSVIIQYDNHGAIALVKKFQVYTKSKYIDMQWHYQREKIKNGSVELWYIPTNQQITDGFIKLLSKDKFWAF